MNWKQAFERLKKEDIERALETADDLNVTEKDHYFLNGYPAKRVIRRAWELKYPDEEVDWNGAGGRERTQKFLESLGFEVEYRPGKEEANVTEWFVSGNPKKYDLINAFKDLGKVDWKQSANIAAGDIVYIYVSDTYQAVRYKCRANKVDLPGVEIEDSKYNISGEFDGSYGRYMELEPIAELEGELYSRTKLEQHGFQSPQSPVRVPAQVKEYLDVVQTLQNAEEMDPYRHDGCYELMREIIKAYGTLSDYTALDHKDLNLVYFSCVGTWTYGFDKKKRDILESHLPQSEKDRLSALLDTIQTRAKNKEYENRERDQDSIGMFGTGFKSFVSKTDAESARKFIQMCVDIQNMDDDDAIFDRCAQVINSDLKGMRAASASMVLHTLKPYVFPIFNSNAGNGNVFKYLGADIKKQTEIDTYIMNCRVVRDFRNSNFTVKNYRIYDRAIWEVGKAGHSNIDFLGIMEYLEENANAKYVNPQSESISAEEKEKYLELKARGQYVVDEYKKVASLANDRFGLQNSGTIQWLDGSNTKLRRYLWAQLKNPKHMDEPYSVSFFTDIDPETKKARFRVCLEVKNDGADKNIMQKYHSYFDMQQDPDISYLAGSNELGNIELVSEPVDVIKQKVESRQYKKVQPSIYIFWSEDLTNDICEEKVIQAIEKVLPYYEHVIGDSDGEAEQTDFWPSQEEYPVNLTKDDWRRFLEEVEYPSHKGCMRVLKCYVDIGGIASPKKMSETYKGHAMVYTSSISNTSRRALKYFNMEPCPDEKNDTQWLFPIAFQGKRGAGGDSGTYVYKMRDELMEALKEMDLEDIELTYKKGAGEMNGSEFGLNTILYGPPGTGKTYNTVRYAVSICEPELNIEAMEYSEILAKYKELKEEGRIEFTTFHQSYGYEEFIEGIKPIMSSGSEVSAGKDIQYDVVPGLFKEFCDRARKKKVETKGFDIASDAKIWKVTIRSEARDDCFDKDRVRIDFSFTSDGAAAFINDIVKGDIIVTTDGSRSRINGVAVVTGDEAYELDADADRTTRDVKWLAKRIDEPIESINSGKILHRMTVARVPKMKVDDIVALANDKGQGLSAATIEENTDPYVFIIDEINRGNISKIFGELITLIEETKRAGADEAMETTLPYSGDLFSVPKNVYILGTMNTADRSIALMDTALRRRFNFEEMMPDESVISGITITDDGQTVDVAKMLTAINDRIEYLYDREHTIGHAFFTCLKEDPSLATLADIFRSKVVPLLQEYFYEDYEKIQLVLGDNEKSDPAFKFILDEKVDERKLFKGSPELDVKEKTYKIQDDAFDLIQSYIEITETVKAEDKSE